jgi:hypothetical protein
MTVMLSSEISNGVPMGAVAARKESRPAVALTALADPNAAAPDNSGTANMAEVT